MSYTIKTKYGDLRVQAPEPDYLFVEFEELKIHNIPRNGHFRLRLVDGVWQKYRSGSDPNGVHALYVSSTWSGQGSRLKLVSASRAAEGKIAEVVLGAVVPWITAHPEVLEGAREAVAKAEVEKARAEVQRLTKELTAAKQFLERVQNIYMSETKWGGLED